MNGDRLQSPTTTTDQDRFALCRRRCLLISRSPAAAAAPPRPPPQPPPRAAGLPGFEGSVAAATLGGPSPAPEAAYLALLCLEGLADFRQGHSWAPQVVPSVETGEWAGCPG